MINDYTYSTLRENIAVCFDYALRCLKIDKEKFTDYFIGSKAVKEIYNQNPKYIFGLSGVELALSILDEKNVKYEYVEYYSYDRSKYYWVGDYLSYYVYKNDYKYSDIFSYTSLVQILRMYEKYHEMDVTKFVDRMEEIRKNMPSKLSLIRKNIGLSQSELSKLSGVSLKSIQAYEQKKKDINKAEVKTVDKLANSLNVEIKDLID